MTSVISNIGGAILGSNASKKSASIQDAAANRAADNEMAMYNQNRADLAPYREAGTQALGRLADLMGTSGNAGADGYGTLTRQFSMADFQKDPGYDFRLGEGMKALERTQAARGGLFSGAAMKAATEYGQNFASNEFDKAYGRYNDYQGNLYNRLAGLSGTGQSATNTTASLGAQATSNANDYRTSGAAARAAGVVGSANSWQTGLQGLNSDLMSMGGMLRLK